MSNSSQNANNIISNLSKSKSASLQQKHKQSIKLIVSDIKQSHENDINNGLTDKQIEFMKDMFEREDIIKIQMKRLDDNKDKKDSKHKQKADHYEKLRQTFKKIILQIDENQEKAKDIQLFCETTILKSTQRLKTQLIYAQQSIQQKSNKIHQLETEVKKKQNDQSLHYTKQLRRNIELLAQKQSQIQSLTKINTLYKQKITNLQQQIHNLTSTIKNNQIMLHKAMEHMKNQINQIQANYQDIELDKVVLQNKFKQTAEKLEIMLEQQHEQQKRQKILKQNYQKLKVVMKQVQAQNIDLQFEVQNYKSKVCQKSIKINNENEKDNDRINQLLQETSSLVSLINLVKNKQSIHTSYQQSQKIIISLKQQQKRSKQQILNKQLEIADIKSQYEKNYHDKVLQDKQPQLYQYLTQKKQQIQAFQSRLDTIQQHIQQYHQNILKVINNSNHKKPSQQNFMEKQYAQSQKQKITNLQAIIKQLLNKQEKNQHEKKQLKTKIIFYKEQVQELQKNQKKNQKKRKRCQYCCLCVYENSIKQCAYCRKLVHTNGKCYQQHNCLKQKKNIQEE